MGDYLHYLIRFENTGTFPAENIVVKDVIDATKFDVASLRLIESSHDCYVRTVNNNQVEFIFKNIQLPFIEPGKHGFVSFKIKTKPMLVLGNAVTNKASIYFDYNLPVITNIATTPISNSVGTGSPGQPQMQVVLHPNPVTDVLFLTTDEAPEKVEIYDAMGRIVLSAGVQNGQINIAQLPQGIYNVKVYSRQSFGIQQIIKH